MPSYNDFSLLSTSAGFLLRQRPYRITPRCTLAVIILLRLTVRTFQEPRFYQIMPVSAHINFSFEPDHDIFVASDLRRDLTVPPDSRPQRQAGVAHADHYRQQCFWTRRWFYRRVLARLFCILEFRFSFFTGSNSRTTAGIRPECTLELNVRCSPSLYIRVFYPTVIIVIFGWI